MIHTFTNSDATRLLVNHLSQNYCVALVYTANLRYIALLSSARTQIVNDKQPSPVQQILVMWLSSPALFLSLATWDVQRYEWKSTEKHKRQTIEYFVATNFEASIVTGVHKTATVQWFLVERTSSASSFCAQLQGYSKMCDMACVCISQGYRVRLN